MAKTLTALEPKARAAKAAGTVVRETIDVSSYDGGYLIPRITNGGTGPTAQCVSRIFTSPKNTSMPAAAAEGVDWFDHGNTFGGGTTANDINERVFEFGPEIAYIMVEFSTHTGTDVTVECRGNGYVYS